MSSQTTRLGPWNPTMQRDLRYGSVDVGNTPPAQSLTVTINQADSQADPAATGPILYTVVFSEPVIGFVTGDVSFAGTATGTLVGAVSGSGANYTISVTGMVDSGTVIATIVAGVATAIATGAMNDASTSTDNTVDWVGSQRDYNAANAASITLSGSEVTAWADSNAIGPTFTDQADPVNVPLYGAIANANGGVRFTFTNDYLYGTPNSSNLVDTAVVNGLTLFVVFTSVSPNARLMGTFISSSASANQFQLWLNASGQVEFVWRNAAAATLITLATTSSFADGNWHIARLTVSAGNASIEVDGANRVTGTYVLSGTNSPDREGFASLVVGASKTLQLNGGIARVLTYNSDMDGSASATAVYNYLNGLYLVAPAPSVVIASSGGHFQGPSAGVTRTVPTRPPADVRAGDIAIYVATKSAAGVFGAVTGWTTRQSGSKGIVLTRTCQNGDGLRWFGLDAGNNNMTGVIYIFRQYLATEVPQASATAVAVSTGDMPYPTATAPAQPHYVLATGHGAEAAAGSPVAPSGTNPTYAVIAFSAFSTNWPRVTAADGTSTSTAAMGTRNVAATGFVATTDTYHGIVLSWLLL